MGIPIPTMPAGGYTTDDLDAMPVNNFRFELTDGALSVSPSPSSLHQHLCAALMMRLADVAPPTLAVTQAVEIRFARQLTRIPDVLVIGSQDPGRHWFAPAEVLLAVEVESPGNHVEDRTPKPALYAQFGIPYYWRIEPDPLRVTTYARGRGDRYTPMTTGDRIEVNEPFPFSLGLDELLPRWARGS